MIREKTVTTYEPVCDHCAWRRVPGTTRKRQRAEQWLQSHMIHAHPDLDWPTDLLTAQQIEWARR